MLIEIVLCENCNLPECDDKSDRCLVRIFKAGQQSIRNARKSAAQRMKEAREAKKAKAYYKTNKGRCKAWYERNKERERARKREAYHKKKALQRTNEQGALLATN